MVIVLSNISNNEDLCITITDILSILIHSIKSYHELTISVIVSNANFG